jgi:hypothetical protein
MKTPFTLLVTLTLLTVAGLGAQPKLQEMLKDTAVAGHWIYDDYTQAVAQAKASKKPLFVTFRCVP